MSENSNSNATKPLRWGIASTGVISFDFANALTTLLPTEHEMVAVAARQEQSAKEFAKKFNIPKYYGGYDKLMQDPDVDIVYIGSIVATHYEIAMMALENGKHVLCEKPLAINEKQVRKLVQTAQDKKLFFMEAIWSRFFESYKLLKERIDDGSLGEIKNVDLEFGFPLQNTQRMFLKNGGGTVLDLGIYTIQICLWAFGSEPTKVIAFGKLNEDGLDMEITGEYHFKNGGLAKIQTSCLRPLSNKCVITGTKGKFILPNFWCPLEVIDVDGTKKSWTLPKAAYEFNLQNSAGLRFEADEARRCINLGLIESPSVTYADSLAIAKVEDNIRKQIGVKFDEDEMEF